MNVDTGKMAWYFQTAPHDMHDWDSAQTPVLVDALFKGRMRKLVMTAARNGYFFVLDRVTGEHLLTTKYGSTTNWVKELRREGTARANNEKDPSVGGALVSPSRAARQLGAAGLPPEDRPVLCLGEQRVLDLLPDRHGSARLDGTGRDVERPRRRRRQLPDRARHQDRQGGVA